MGTLFSRLTDKSTTPATSVAPKTAQKGTTATVTYQTTYRKRVYDKQAVVYLPADYQATARHNIIYLMHGSTESPQAFYRDGQFKKHLDELATKGTLRRTIVVFPTYYPSPRFVSDDYYQDYPLNQRFAQQELVDDLMPAVEKAYRTYADEPTRQGFQASRQHRAFGGFSMGAITTWEVFETDLAYVHDFMPMAGDSWAIKPDGGAQASQATAKLLAEAGKQRSFQIMAAVGGQDGTQASMQPQIDAMWQQTTFNRQNLKYYVQPNGSHSPQSISHQFQHYAGDLFKNE